MSNDGRFERGAGIQSQAVDRGQALREAAVARATSLGAGAVANASMVHEQVTRPAAPSLPSHAEAPRPEGAAAHAAAVAPGSPEIETEPVR